MKTELVPKVTGPGQRTKRDCFGTNKAGLFKGGHCDQMAMDGLEPLHQVLESRHAVQQLVPVSLASGFLISAPMGPWVHKLAVYLDLCLIFLLLRFSLKKQTRESSPAHKPKFSLSLPS